LENRINRDDNRLGVAVQLCTLPWLGWITDDLTGCPLDAVARLAITLAIDRRFPGASSTRAAWLVQA
jgi:hypothetical protein